MLNMCSVFNKWATNVSRSGKLYCVIAINFDLSTELECDYIIIYYNIQFISIENLLNN